jgi:hypothetical protein
VIPDGHLIEVGQSRSGAGTNASRREWPDKLDALAAPPAKHRLLLESERVRVLETGVGVADRTPMHTHTPDRAWNTFLSATSFVRRDGDVNVTLDTPVGGSESRASEALWSGPFSLHSLENVGGTKLRVIMAKAQGLCVRIVVGITGPPGCARARSAPGTVHSFVRPDPLT